GFSGARIVPGADAWRERETSMRLDPDGWLVRRNIADATIMKTRMRLRSHIGGGVCLSERNEKKCQKLCKGDVLPLDRYYEGPGGCLSGTIIGSHTLEEEMDHGSHSRRRRMLLKINGLSHLTFVNIKPIESTTYAFYAASNAASFELTC